IDAVVAAVERGEIPEERIDRSVRRLLRAKGALRLHERRTVDLDRVADVVGSREHYAVAAEIAARSITAARDRDGLLPLTRDRIRRALSIVYTDDYDPLAGRTFQRSLARLLPGTRAVSIDARTTPRSSRTWARTCSRGDRRMCSRRRPPGRWPARHRSRASCRSRSRRTTSSEPV